MTNMADTTEATIHPRLFRDTLGHFASGITIIGGTVDGKPAGFTCQSFYSVSTDPPLISFSVMTTSSTWPRIQPTGKFSVNVLSHHQHHISTNFGRSGIDRWAGVEWRQTAGGNPVIQDALMSLDCQIYDIHRAGDHDIVVGLVKEIVPPDTSRPTKPLLYYKGAYCHIQEA